MRVSQRNRRERRNREKIGRDVAAERERRSATAQFKDSSTVSRITDM